MPFIGRSDSSFAGACDAPLAGGALLADFVAAGACEAGRSDFERAPLSEAFGALGGGAELRRARASFVAEERCAGPTDADGFTDARLDSTAPLFR